MPNDQYPLFPLKLVLYTGGYLSLRIFEPRYLDMVRDCAKAGRPFGICCVHAVADDVSGPKVCVFGTLARIVDFDTLPDGLLGIQVLGEKRFRTLRTSVRDNGLIMGELQILPADPSIEVEPEFSVLVGILRSLLEQVGGVHAKALEPQFDDAAWVAYRIAEILPLELVERQSLLELDDPEERMRCLLRWLPRFQQE
jgi:uncharacterized protein